ncbi:vesicle-associated membrane protein [Thraustotheca clavata]|uniref:Vesicle-associated membrane protein n=1 Tax=Thraustotheca clavata TaxID=74557 RepID=A0A1W0A2W1_9STRA|nr:vesicle-associated membrane protein [Thraustotheca clavata]
MAIVYALVARGKIVLAEYTASSGNFPTVTRVLLAKIPLEDSKMSYVYDMHVFHYIVKDGITYLCMADNDFKRRVPFQFLEDMKNRFLTTYGDRGRTAIAFAMNAEFQHVIQRQMDYFNANPEVDTVIQVQQSLDEVKDTMVENIEKVLGRGEKFELLVDRTDQLNQQSFVFNRKSRKLRKAMWWRSMKMWLCLGCLAVLIIYFVISMACGFDFSSCKASPPKSKIQEV